MSEVLDDLTSLDRDDAPSPGLMEQAVCEHPLNVQAVEVRTGVCAETLRTWERRYGWPRPRRLANGYRIYSEDDVALIIAVKREMDRGAAAAVAWQRALAGQPRCSPCQAIRSPEWLGTGLMDCLMGFDADGALALLSEAHATYPLEQVLTRIVQPALVEIGERWRAEEASVAQEHFAANLLRDSLAQMARAYRPRNGAATVVVGAAPGDWHELGALTVSLLLRRGGHRVIYLGQNTAGDGLAQAVETTRARMVLLSATRLETAEAVSEVTTRLSGLKPRPAVVFGGRAFAQRPSLASRVCGTYVQGDATEAAGRLDEILAAQGGGQ